MRTYKRNIVRVCICICILSVLSLITSISIGMLLGEENSRNTIKDKLLPSATITENIDKINNQISKNNEVNVLTPDLNTIMKIGELENVEYYDYSFPTYIEANNLNLVNLANLEYISPLIQLIGISKMEMSDLKLGRINLSAGRLPTDEEIKNGNYVAVISKKFADMNNIQLGDKLTNNIVIRSRIDASQQIEVPLDLKIIGFFTDNLYKESDNKNKLTNLKNRSDILNNFYVPNKVSKEIFIYQEENAAKAFPKDYDNLKDSSGRELSTQQFLQQIKEEDYYEPVYLIKSEKDLKLFENQASKILNKFEYMKILNNKMKYEYIVKNISHYTTVFRVIWSFSFILSIVLLVILFLNIKKNKWIGLCILPIFAILFSSSLYFGQKISVTLPYELIYPELRIDGIEKEHVHQESEQNSDGNTENDMEDWDDYAYKRIDPQMIDLSDVTKEYKVTINKKYVLYYLTSSIGSIVISLFISKFIIRIIKNKN